MGSNYEPVNQKVWEVVKESGPVTGLFHPYEMKLAEKIHECMPWVEMYRCLASGTEADMVAIRIARTYTGKQNIVKVGGAYHGWSDQLVYSLHIPYTQTFEAHGIPKRSDPEHQGILPWRCGWTAQGFGRKRKERRNGSSHH